MKVLQEEHAAQKREVGLTGPFWGAWFPTTSSHPALPILQPRPPLNSLADNFLLILFLAADPHQYTEGSAAQRATSLAGSRGLWAFSSETNTSFLCGFLCSDPVRCSKEGGAVQLRELPGLSVFGPSFETPTRRDPGGCGPQ